MHLLCDKMLHSDWCTECTLKNKCVYFRVDSKIDIHFRINSKIHTILMKKITTPQYAPVQFSGRDCAINRTESSNINISKIHTLSGQRKAKLSRSSMIEFKRSTCFWIIPRKCWISLVFFTLP